MYNTDKKEKNKCDKKKNKISNNNINMKKLIKSKNNLFKKDINNITEFLSSKRIKEGQPLNYVIAGAEFMNGSYFIDLGDKNKLYDLIIKSFDENNFTGMITEYRSQYYPMFFDIDEIPFKINPNDFIDNGLEEFIIIENSNNNNLELKKYKIHFPNLIVDSNFMLYFLAFIKNDELLSKYHKYMDKCVYTTNGNRLLYTQGDKKTYYGLENATFYGMEEITDKLELMDMISIYTNHKKFCNELIEFNNELFKQEELKDIVKKDIELIKTAPFISKKHKLKIIEKYNQKFTDEYVPQNEIEIAINKCLSYLNVENLNQVDWFKCLIICKKLNTPEIFWKWNSTYSKLNEAEDKKRWENATTDKLSYGTLHYLIKKYNGEEFYKSIANEINICKKKEEKIILPTRSVLKDIAYKAFYGQHYQKYKSPERNQLLNDCDGHTADMIKNMKSALMKKLNQHITMILGDGTIHYILENFNSDNDFDIKKNERDIKLIFRNRDITIEIIKSSKKGNAEFHVMEIDLFTMWLDSSERKEKLKKIFNPTTEEEEDKENFNLFRGFNFSKSDMELWGNNDIKYLTDHILNIWCKGNKIYCDYVLNYFAHIYQKPNKKTMVMLCVKSLYEGAGKSLTIHKLMEGLGEQYIFATGDKEQVLGRFNGQMSRKLIILLEEAFFSGDKKSKSKLKEYITATTIPVEKKGIDTYVEDAFHNYISFSNETWYAPVDNGSRRYFCLEASNKYAGVQNEEKKEYFSNIANIDPRNIAKYFYERDISDFNPRQFKLTKYMIDQMIHGFNSVEKYIHYLLEQGFIKMNTMTDMNGNEIEEKLEFNKPIQKERIYAYYKNRYEKDYSFIRDEGLFWKKMKEVLTDTDEKCYMEEFRPHKSKRMVKFKSFNICLEFWKEKYGYDPHNDNMLNMAQEDMDIVEGEELDNQEYLIDSDSD